MIACTHEEMDVKDSHAIYSPAMVSSSPRSTWQSFPGLDSSRQDLSCCAMGTSKSRTGSQDGIVFEFEVADHFNAVQSSQV